MKEYSRKYPLYSLCGLNCGLCPNYHSDKAFRCTGCGGDDFYSIHPACAIISCSKKHGDVEFCFSCEKYPCERYRWMKKTTIYDSFITYRNVGKDVMKVKTLGIDVYYTELEEKVELLRCLLKNYNMGRQKTFFCLAVNLLELEDINSVMKEFETTIDKNNSKKENSKLVVEVFNNLAHEKGVILKLNKNK